MKRLLLVTLLAMVLLVGACGAPPPTPVAPTTPAPAPVPAPPPAVAPQPEPPVDKPRLSAEEVIANIWTRLPDKIAGKYDKSLFDLNARAANYEANGKWTFEASGAIKETVDLPPQVYMETKTVSGKPVEAWFEELKRKTTSVDLKLTAVFYENTMILDAVEVKESNRQESTDIVATKPLKGELQVEWITATYAGAQYHIEGNVKNIGKMRLSKVKIEIADLDETGKVVNVKTYPLSAETINPGETAHFRADYFLTGKAGKYAYRFVSDTGPEITYLRPGETPPPTGKPQA